MNVIRIIRNYIENKHVQGNKANYDWLTESKEQLESSLFAKPELVIKEDTDEGGYVAYYPDLPGCITCGETIEEAKANAIDAKDAWIEAVIGLTEEEKRLLKATRNYILFLLPKRLNVLCLKKSRMNMISKLQRKHMTTM